MSSSRQESEIVSQPPTATLLDEVATLE